MSNIILHIDLDAFFCRAEEIKFPFLEGKAFIVGGDGRKGIVSTCSYKAREYGIHSGMPTFQAKMLCKDLIIRPVDFEFYGLLSKEFVNYLKQYSDKVQQVSIDECFLDLTDFYRKNKTNIKTLLLKIQNELFEKFKLKSSIGVGTTKFIAKMASDYKKPLGITIIRNKDIPTLLFPLPVKSFFGIGKKTYPKLQEIGINTIGDLYNECLNHNPELISILGNYVEEIPLYLEGKSSDEIDSSYDDPKSIGMSRTLDYDTNNVEKIQQILNKEIDNVLNSLKKEGKFIKTITITYKNASHEESFKTTSFSKSFKEFTKDEVYIRNEAIKLFNKTYNKEMIRLIGFSVKNFKNKSEVVTQMTFDDYKRHEQENTSFLIINELNREVNKKLFIKCSDILKKD